jgi:tRNA threonylcarbamoyladenosine biosynthesis protein TsaE
LEIMSHGPEETRAIGRAMGANAVPGDIFLLVGGLGTGKTCLTQGVLWGLGSGEYARSPTFVLMAQYRGRIPLYHVDLYRLDSLQEVADLGLDEYLLGDGVCVVEWAEKAPAAFPDAHLMVRIDLLDDTTRRMTLTATDRRHGDVIGQVRSAISG